VKNQNNSADFPTSTLLVILLLLFNVLLFLAYWSFKNQEVALFLLKHPVVLLPYITEKVGLPKLFLAVLGTICLLRLLFIRSSNDKTKVLRGASISSSGDFKKLMKKQPKPKDQPQIHIAGIPIPARLENRGFFFFGSPGTGKTQAISQVLSILKQRSDMRGIVFDRNGEMLKKFYDPQKDLIFNPFDLRSVSWSHINEPVRPETMAAGLIPLPASPTKDPFFPTAGRAVMSELFRKTKNNKQLYSMLNSKISDLSTFLSGTLASRYLGENKEGGGGENKLATSVLASINNYCEFYRSMTELTSKPISFFNWAYNDDPRWIFVTLREDDVEVLKPLHTLLFELMLKGLLSNEERTKKTAIIIDELGALNQLPSLNRLLSESRKFLGCPFLGTQTEVQVSKIYGNEDTQILLQGTMTKLMLRCGDPQTAETMAKLIGKQEKSEIITNHSRSSGSFGKSPTKTVNQVEQRRETFAVLPSEIQNLPDLDGYLKIDGIPAAAVRVPIVIFPIKTPSFVSLTEKNSQAKVDSIKEQWKNI
jgi:hypothetical protein